MLSKRWNRLWRAVAGTAPEPVFSRLSAAYGEPHRFYHNLGHIADCLGWFDRAEEPVSDRQAVELAIWFHDVVYDTRSSDNEEKSAVWAERSLERGGVRSSLVEKVGHLVRLTSHRSFPDDPDTRVLLDVDLAILGSAPARFAYYQRAIREEYRWVPEPSHGSAPVVPGPSVRLSDSLVSRPPRAAGAPKPLACRSGSRAVTTNENVTIRCGIFNARPLAALSRNMRPDLTSLQQYPLCCLINLQI
jgi:predicted metal-dependent HD superfamily phosphohydrolase